MHNRFALVSFLAAFSLLAACGGGDGNTAPDASAGGSPDADTSGTIDAAVAIDAATSPDATPAALACAGDALPTTVTAPPIVIAGTVQEGSTGGIVTMTQSAHVSAHLVSNDTILVQGDFTGAFSLTDPGNSATPIDAYLKSTSAGFVDTYVYPPYAIFESLANTPVIMVSSTIFGLLPILTGVTQASGNGALIVAVVDCNNDPIEGAVVSITPSAGTLKYAGATGIPGMTNFPSTQAAGVGYIFNLPPGEYTIGASVGGVDLRGNVVKAFADASTTLVVAP